MNLQMEVRQFYKRPFMKDVPRILVKKDEEEKA